MKKILCASFAFLFFALLLCSCGQEPVPKIDRGVQTDKTYTNESLGIVFNLPDGWRFYTDDEIAATMDISKELLRDESLLDSADITSVIEFIAADGTSNANSVNLTIENLKVSGNQNMTLDEYAELSKSTLQEQLAGAGYTFSKNSMMYLGENNDQYLRLTASCIYGTRKMTQYFCLRKVGDYIVLITMTSTDNTPASVFDAMFGKAQ